MDTCSTRRGAARGAPLRHRLHAPAVALLVAAVLWSSATAANDASVQRLTCKRLSGAPMHDLTLVIDDNRKTLTVTPDGLLPTDEDPDAVTFKATAIDWFYMRGTAELDRKTGLLVWDDTEEYAYLENIGQAEANDSADNYRGSMQCKAASTSGG